MILRFKSIVILNVGGKKKMVYKKYIDEICGLSDEFVFVKVNELIFVIKIENFSII